MTEQPKAPRRRAPKKPSKPRGKPGPVLVVARGFDRTLLRQAALDKTPDDQLPPDPWARQWPAAQILNARRAGATWELAAGFGKVHPASLRSWITRGETAMTEHADLVAAEASGLDDETLACCALYILDQQADVIPGVSALNSISRAMNGGDWRAGVAMLDRHPRTKRDFAQVTKIEASGPEGGAIPVEVRARGLADVLRRRVAASRDESAVDGAERPDDDVTAGDG